MDTKFDDEVHEFVFAWYIAWLFRDIQSVIFQLSYSRRYNPYRYDKE